MLLVKKNWGKKGCTYSVPGEIRPEDTSPGTQGRVTQGWARHKGGQDTRVGTTRVGKTQGWVTQGWARHKGG